MAACQEQNRPLQFGWELLDGDPFGTALPTLMGASVSPPAEDQRTEEVEVADHIPDLVPPTEPHWPSVPTPLSQLAPISGSGFVSLALQVADHLSRRHAQAPAGHQHAHHPNVRLLLVQRKERIARRLLRQTGVCAKAPTTVVKMKFSTI